MKAIDFETIGLLLGLFLVIRGITNMGVIYAAVIPADIYFWLLYS